MNSGHCIRLAHKVGVPIQKLSAETMAQLISAPQAQLRTSKYKKAVKFVEDLVFKGPYTCDDEGLMKNLRYTYAIELLEAALQLHEWQRGSLRWKYLGCGDDKHYYLVSPNVGKWIDIHSEPANSKLETNVKVVPRGVAVWRVSDIEGTGQLTADIKSATLQHLYLGFLLDIGDSGTYNVLIRQDYVSTGRLIAGIDLEQKISNKVKERRLKAKNRRLNLLFSKVPFPKHISLYQSDVCKIKSLSYSQLDQPTSDRLSAVGIDIERLKENMDLWVKTPI